MPTNQIDQFRSAMALCGLLYDGPLRADGKLHRFRAKGDHRPNSWYVIHPGPPWAGAFGCWKRGINETWCKRNDREYSQAEWNRIRQGWKDADQRRQEVEAKRQEAARRLATKIVSQSQPASADHPYLQRKGVGVHGGLRRTGDVLVLPLRDAEGKLWTLQFIAPNEWYGDGEGKRDKTYLRGGKKTGAFFKLAGCGEGPLVIAEGYATAATIHEATGHDVVAAMDAGNLLPVAKVLRKRWPDRELIIAADNDAWKATNPGVTKATEAAKAVSGKLAIPHFKRTESKPTDFNDLQQLEGLPAVREQLELAAMREETEEELFARLAAMPLLEYGKTRKAISKRTQLPVSLIDSEVEKRRTAKAGAESHNSILPRRPAEPWSEPVDGSALLGEIAATLRRYVVLGQHEADALSLFIVFTYATECFDSASYVHVSSPEKRCGKSLLLRLLGGLCDRALPAANCSDAAICRALEAERPTLIIDEVDTFLRDRSELRGVLNAGNNREEAYILRTEETRRNGVKGFTPRRLCVFGPKAFSGIGRLADTLSDRCIPIRMRRKKASDRCERYRQRKVDLDPLRRKCRRFIDDHADELRCLEPELPAELNDRAADVWEPLIAVAMMAGGDWPAKATEAALALSGEEVAGATDTKGQRLLRDIYMIFADRAGDRISSEDLSEKLNNIEEAPWAEERHGQGMNPNKLAELLRRYGISSRKLRFPKPLQGYPRDDFSDAWERYTPEVLPANNWNNGTSPAPIGDNGDSETGTESQCSTPDTATPTNNDGHCSSVPVQGGGNGTPVAHADPVGVPQEGFSEEVL